MLPPGFHLGLQKKMVHIQQQISPFSTIPVCKTENLNTPPPHLSGLNNSSGMNIYKRVLRRVNQKTDPDNPLVVQYSTVRTHR